MKMSAVNSLETKRWLCPKRYVVTLLGFAGMFNAYAMRVNLSVAVVAMVNNTLVAPEPNGSVYASECPLGQEALNSSFTTDYKGERYTWDPEMQGWVLSSFFYGYCVSGIFGGYIAEKFGAVRVFGLSLFFTGILTLFTPVAVGWGVVPLLIVRFLEGIVGGSTLPAMASVVSSWSPKFERTRMSAIMMSGTTVGTVAGLWMSGWLCSTTFLGGWPAAFYVIGFITCIWYLFWYIFIYDTPHNHPSIDDSELSRFSGQEIKKDKGFKVPWKEIFTSVPVWAVVSGNIGCLFSAFLLLTELPTFLSTALHFNVNDAGMLSALPYVLYCFSMWTASYLADRLRRSGCVSTSSIRKIFQGIGGYGAGMCLLAITLSGCRPSLIIVFFSLALSCQGFMYSGFNIIHVDMSPDFAGTLYGLTNGIASFSGIIGPPMAGFFTSNGYSMANWNKVFYVTVVIYCVSTTIFVAFASAELQQWGRVRKTQTMHKTVNTTCNVTYTGAANEHTYSLSDAK